MAKAKPVILHLITGLELGGTETALTRVLPLLQDQFENIVVCIRGRGPMAAVLQKKGIGVEFLDLSGPFDVGAIWRFRRIIRAHQPALVATYLIHADLFGRVLGRLFGVRRILCNKRGGLIKLVWADRLTRSMVTLWVAQTEVAKKMMISRLKVPATKITVIPNGLESHHFASLRTRAAIRKELAIAPDAVVIICVANLKSGKGHTELLEAFDQMHNRVPCELVLVGEGPLRRELEERAITKTDVSRVHFLGTRTDVQDLLQASDIFALPTYSEGMSNAVLEAMAARLPIVTTDIAPNRELIDDGQTGLLVPVKDTEHLTTALLRLAQTPALRTQLGQAAFAAVTSHYTLQTVTHKLLTLYRGLL